MFLPWRCERHGAWFYEKKSSGQRDALLRVVSGKERGRLSGRYSGIVKLRSPS